MDRNDGDPTLRRVRVDIKYRASNGYCVAAGYASSETCDPKNALLAAADELARICELFGFGDDVVSASMGAVNRVRVSRAKERTP